MTLVQWTVVNEFFRESAIIDRKDFGAPRSSEADTRREEIWAVSAERQSIGLVAEK